MANTRDIQRRIKSVGNISKITKAMEMVAAAKMRRAVEAALKTRTYANLSWETVLNIVKSAGSKEPMHELLTPRVTIKRVAIVLITSNRGLCGGFNAQLFNKVRESIKKHQTFGEDQVIETDFILVGKKGEAMEKFGYKIAAIFPKADITFSYSEIVPTAKMVIDEFTNGYYDKILVAYNNYESAVKQAPRVKQLLPVELSTADNRLGVVGKSPRLEVKKDFIEEKTKEHLAAEGFTHEYTFEPSALEVLNKIVPRLVEVQLFQALLESNASEHSARMAAMHQANDAAGDMVSDLILFYNKARQASITAEIAEISAGANALN